MLPRKLVGARWAVLAEAAHNDHSRFLRAPGVAVGLQGIGVWDAAQRAIRERDHAVAESVL